MAVAAAALAACAGDPPAATPATPSTTTGADAPTDTGTDTEAAVATSLAAARRTPGSVPAGTPPPVVTAGRTDTGAVALTFDADLTPGMRQRLRDGRVDSYANMAVVDVLRRTGTPATVFFTGLWMEEYPEHTAAIAADPLFEVATHSHTHRAFRDGCYGLGVVPTGEMAAEVTGPIALLARYTDRPTRYFRFPGLCHDPHALAAIASAGVTVVDGMSSGDAGGRSVDAIVEQTVTGAQAGAIVVLHLDGGDAAPLTDEALPGIIDGLRGRGLRFVRLSELLSD
ncbi:MAG TPA: polysaccharide deacetylase family protein [Acidimicrobiales bacterium]